MRDLKLLIREVHRRSLWQVLAIYLTSGWIALQVVDTLSSTVGLPEWVAAFAIVLLVLGLPIVLATAFVQEGIRSGESDGGGAPQSRAGRGRSPTPGRRDKVAATPTRSERLFTWRNAGIAGAGGLTALALVSAVWLVFGSAAAEAIGARAEAASVSPSIAVLPFVTRSQVPEDEYFAEGMHDDLLTQLAKIEALTVISRTSVQQYAATQKRIPEIARELGVAAVLEGGIQRAGSRIRVNVQLIEAASDRHLWAETYDEELTAANVFAIQSDLAHKIASALHTTLRPEEARRIDVRPTASLEAYELYNRARRESRTVGTGADPAEAIRLYEAAIEADPSFAEAWTALALTHLTAAEWRSTDVDGPTRRRILEGIDRAMAVNPEFAGIYLVRAFLFESDGLMAQAGEEYRRALELNPGDATLLRRYGGYLQAIGRIDEAIRTAERAIEIDPLDPDHRSALADRLFFAGRFEESIVQSRRQIAIDPSDWYDWYNLGWANAGLRRAGDALSAFREAERLAPTAASYTGAGIAYTFSVSGQRDSALIALQGIDVSIAGYDVAIVHYELGNVEQAFALLEAALRQGSYNVYTRFETDPLTAPMRADPRYPGLIQRLGLAAR